MGLFWWQWFQNSEDLYDKRKRIISSISGSFAAMFIIRIISKFSHFRTRPILDPANHLITATGFDVARIPDTHNSFPSDHGTLFYALATGLYFVSKRAGIFAYIYVTLIVAFPRIYVGLHYPTDILAGALVGILIVCLTNMRYIRTQLGGKALSYSHTHPGIFYFIFFMLSFQIGTLFDSSRAVIHFIASFFLHGSAWQ